MIAEWILIYAVVFVLCAVVVGHVPTKHWSPPDGVRRHRQQCPRDRTAGWSAGEAALAQVPCVWSV